MLRLAFFHSKWHCTILELYYPRLSILMSPPLRILWYSCIFIYRLHEQKFVKLLIYVILDAKCTHFFTCACPTVGTWWLAHPTTLAFHLSWIHFLTTSHTHLDLSHPIIAHLSRCPCGHVTDDLGIHVL
jgi:hypothetical protein